jgi:hypothetical protein
MSSKRTLSGAGSTTKPHPIPLGFIPQIDEDGFFVPASVPSLLSSLPVVFMPQFRYAETQ